MEHGGDSNGYKTPRPCSNTENGKPAIEGGGQVAHGEEPSEGQTDQKERLLKKMMDYRDSVRLGYELFHMIEAHTELMDTLRDMHLDHLEFELPVETQNLLDHIDKVQIGLQREFCGTTVCGEKKKEKKLQLPQAKEKQNQVKMKLAVEKNMEEKQLQLRQAKEKKQMKMIRAAIFMSALDGKIASQR